MALKLNDLGELGRRTLRALAELQVGNRREISERAQITRQQTSSALSRLENFELVQAPPQTGGAWTITAAGQRLVTGQPLDPVQESTAAPEVEPEIASATEPVADPPMSEEPDLIPTQFISDALTRNREIEDALTLVKTRLRCSLLPARAVRIHREIMNSLPPVLREELLPIELMILAARE